MDGAKAHFFERLLGLPHLKGLHSPANRHRQQLGSKADPHHGSALFVPAADPTELAVQPGHAGLVAFIHPHGATQHQGDCARAGGGIGEGITAIGANGVNGHPSFAGEGGVGAGSFDARSAFVSGGLRNEKNQLGITLDWQDTGGYPPRVGSDVDRGYDNVSLNIHAARDIGRGEVSLPLRHGVPLPFEPAGSNVLLVMPGALPDPAVFGAKLLSLYPGNSQAAPPRLPWPPCPRAKTGGSGCVHLLQN